GTELWDSALPAARPVANNASYIFAPGVPLSVLPPGVAAGNPASAGPYTTSVVSTTTHGTLTLNLDGSFTYVPNAGFDGKDSFTFTVANSTGTSLLAGTVTLSSEDFRWVQDLYVDLLHRAPGATSDAEVLFWVNQLSGGMTRAQVATIFANSTEYRSGLINNYYEEYLGRPVDLATEMVLLQEMNQGLTADGVVETILSSDEFFLRSGPAGFVNNLYQDLLGRQATLPEAGFWKQELIVNGVPRSTIVAAFLASIEYDTMVTETLYGRYLGRPADAAALVFWQGQLAAGHTPPDLEVALAASNEFYTSGVVTPPVPSSGAPGAPPAPLLVY
ncbi:MAG TPA: DUF4214 domain-containing protein, partial [Pirellulales bacterium]|nr:DUF4214 domain-containing protein [Pirellulales bacterium]